MERGVVKWFNQVSDYGFVASDDGGPDRYVRGGNFAGTRATLREGLRVAFEARDGGMGPEAINVRGVAPIHRRSTGSFEPGRRHGAHDPRFRRSHTAAPPVRTAVPNGNGGLGWYAFVARFFPDRNRHNLEALKAFEWYGNASSGWGIAKQQEAARPPGLQTLAGSSTSAPPRAGYGRLSVTETAERLREAEPVAVAVSDWEGEGGALP
jgi:CspA family cold shock protein